MHISKGNLLLFLALPCDAAVPRHEARPLSFPFLPGASLKIAHVFVFRTSRKPRSFLGSLIFHTFNTVHSDSLRAGRSGDRIPEGTRFSASAQTVPGAHPASCTMVTGSFPGVKQSGRGVDHPFPSRAEVEGRVELYIYSPSGPSWTVRG